MSSDASASPPMPLPIVDLDTGPFWEGCRMGKLMLQKCTGCGTFRYPPKPMCPKCSSFDTEWVASTGRGTVYSWMVARHPVHPSIANKVPYNIVLVELDEGPRIVAGTTGIAPGQVEAGMPVRVQFEQLTAEISVPVFAAVDGQR